MLSGLDLGKQGDLRHLGKGFTVKGLGLRLQPFRAKGLGLRARVKGLGFKVLRS